MNAIYTKSKIKGLDNHKCIAPDSNKSTYEKIPVKIFSNYKEVSRAVAEEIASLIKVKKELGQMAV